jgi:hypothetical protein
MMRGGGADAFGVTDGASDFGLYGGCLYGVLRRHRGVTAFCAMVIVFPFINHPMRFQSACARSELCA